MIDFEEESNFFNSWIGALGASTDYGHPVRKSLSLHGRKSNPNPKFIGTAEAYFVCQPQVSDIIENTDYGLLEATPWK